MKNGHLNNWPHKFSNGLTYGSSVVFRHEGKLINCAVQYELYCGNPINLRIIPFNNRDKISKVAGTSRPITEEELLNPEIIIPNKENE